MAKPNRIAAADYLAAPPGHYPLNEAAERKAIAAWYGDRLERRQKQHERLCKSAARFPPADLANAASTLLLELMETKELLRMQDRVLHLLREQRAQIGSDVAAMVERLQTIDDAKKRASDARHARGRQHKQRALRLYEENRANYSSKEAAAEAISKMVPVGRLTIRKWLHNL